jgi:hypothetical protein
MAHFQDGVLVRVIVHMIVHVYVHQCYCVIARALSTGCEYAHVTLRNSTRTPLSFEREPAFLPRLSFRKPPWSGFKLWIPPGLPQCHCYPGTYPGITTHSGVTAPRPLQRKLLLNDASDRAAPAQVSWSAGPALSGFHDVIH